MACLPRDPSEEKKRTRAMRRWFGRPTKAQRHLIERLLAALAVDFEEEGLKAISALREKDPGGYLRLIAFMAPKSLLDMSAGRTYDDEDIADAIAQVRRMAAVHLASLGPCIEGTGSAADPPGLPSLRETD